MNQTPEHAIAVVGMAGRFPNARNVETFWHNIVQSKEAITFFKTEDLISAGISTEQIQSPHYVKARGIIEGAELFDAEFFGIPPREAQIIDPQHRLFLECAFEALENANCDPDRYSGMIGVYGGVGRSTYFLHNLYPNSHLMETMGDYLIRIGNEQDFFASRVSYKLNLKGPSLSIQTACSSSLVSICVACNHLLTYQCDMALAGGSSIFVPQQSGYTHQEGMIFSQDGHCKPFDAEAQGTVPGNGVGVVVLKRLEDALTDQDTIYAVIRGYGLNNDGGEKISYSAPSVKGQTAAIESAILMAEIDPATISLVEAHGTGTFLGDPVEIEALTKAFRQFTQEKDFCAVGSVKSNIGHLMEASGVAGFIKSVLAIYHKKLPPTLHFNTKNPHIETENSPFYINTELKEWPSATNPRRASVSSFGVGGTNAHIILEEAPKLSIPLESELTIPYLLILSAKTPSALDAMSRNLGNYIKANPALSLTNVSYSLQVGRKEFTSRRFIICSGREEAIDTLLSLKNGISSPQSTSREKLLDEMGNSWISGGVIDWATFWSEEIIKPRRISLPTYPFERKKNWIDPPSKIKVKCHTSLPQKKENLFSDVENRLLEIWRQNLGIEIIGLDDSFFTLGGDSLLAIQVLSQIEKEIGISLKLQTFYQFPTISRLAVAIFQQSETSCLISLRASTKDGLRPLFLIPGIEGNIHVYKPLVEMLTFQGQIFGIQLDHADRKNITLEEAASRYIDEIRKEQPKGPYLLCGFSFGGIIAYEMARQLTQKEEVLGFLGIIDAINPRHDLIRQRNELETLAFLIELLEGKEISSAALKNLTSKDLIERLLSSLGLNLLTETQQQRIFEEIQQHLKALKNYTPDLYRGNVIFFEAKDRSLHTQSVHLSTTWESLIIGKIEIHEITGNHTTMMKTPHVENLAKLMSLHLQNIDYNGPKN